MEKKLRARAKANNRSDDRVFHSCYDGFRRALKRAGLKLPKGQASHVLRHTFASHYMINGGNIVALKEALGHSTLLMTQRYAHLSPDHMDSVLKFRPKR